MKAEKSSLKTKRIAYWAIFVALGAVLGAISFPYAGAKVAPGQHLLNVVSGILLGPIDAAAIAILVGFLRNAMGTGTLLAFPGGIPGGIIVGTFFWTLRKMNLRKNAEFSAFTEPIGTVLIGAPIAGLLALATGILAPSTPIEFALSIYWLSFSLSSITGCILGFILISLLKRQHITRETVYG